jgi:hypothetical protein
MATGITTPQSGQPIDVKIISEMATAINNLASTVNANPSAVSKIDNGTTDGPKESRTSSVKFQAFVLPVPAGNRKAGDVISWNANLDFTYTPIVVVTPVSNTGIVAENDVNIIIRLTTPTNVSGNVLFNKDGNVNISLNVMAIGIKQ